MANINDLPDEVLEYIFQLIPPYIDINACCCVNKRWKVLCDAVKSKVAVEFRHALETGNLIWKEITTTNIPPRYGHSSVVYGNYMYVFGGFTPFNTAYNDMWKLNLSSGSWVRVIAHGQYPSPKGCATLVTYNDIFLLYGGMASPLKSVQDRQFLCNDLHLYYPKVDRWTKVVPNCSEFSTRESPRLAAHSATVHGDYMIMFGGIAENICSNKVYTINLKKMSWMELPIINPESAPAARYKHSQIYVDDTCLIVMGGCRDLPFTSLHDVWLLKKNPYGFWSWISIHVPYSDPVMSTVWCHSLCRAGDFIIGFGLSGPARNPANYVSWVPGIDARQIPPFVHPVAIPTDMYLSQQYSTLQIFIASIPSMLEKCRITWQLAKTTRNNPNDTILYSVVEGNGELIMFGGICRRPNEHPQDELTTTVVTVQVRSIQYKKKVF